MRDEGGGARDEWHCACHLTQGWGRMKGMKGSEQIRSSRQPGARFDRRGGFTPLEFLVLIVMIAVQGAMVLPASGRW